MSKEIKEKGESGIDPEFQLKKDTPAPFIQDELTWSLEHGDDNRYDDALHNSIGCEGGCYFSKNQKSVEKDSEESTIGFDDDCDYHGYYNSSRKNISQKLAKILSTIKDVLRRKD